MTVTAVIPARFASSRFPGKPLVNETGRYLVQHVYDRVASCATVDEVVVATDDERILDAVASFGGRACMTRADHASGTDRVAEVSAQLGHDDDDVVLNVQGDEPEIDPGDIGALVAELTAARERIATLACPFPADGPRSGPGSPLDPNCVKVVCDGAGCALYFSRSLVPYPRDDAGSVADPSAYLLHMGIYGFRADGLRAVTSAGPGVLERRESLEQLRWLEHGHAIRVRVVNQRAAGIDTPEDYAAFVTRFRSADPARAGSPSP